jgi:exopolysaccharide biosynthesis predicted pyruvyltransferase EpsI
VRACSSYTSNVALNGETFRSILKKYRRADVVVTSRLHGAIIANSLGRPYVALIRDRKFEAFHATYGHGVECSGLSELPARIEAARQLPRTRRIDYEAVEAFGAKARAIIAGMAR